MNKNINQINTNNKLIQTYTKIVIEINLINIHILME